MSSLTSLTKVASGETFNPEMEGLITSLALMNGDMNPLLGYFKQKKALAAAKAKGGSGGSFPGWKPGDPSGGDIQQLSTQVFANSSAIFGDKGPDIVEQLRETPVDAFGEVTALDAISGRYLQEAKQMEAILGSQGKLEQGMFSPIQYAQQRIAEDYMTGNLGLQEEGNFPNGWFGSTYTYAPGAGGEAPPVVESTITDTEGRAVGSQNVDSDFSYADFLEQKGE